MVQCQKMQQISDGNVYQIKSTHCKTNCSLIDQFDTNLTTFLFSDPKLVRTGPKMVGDIVDRQITKVSRDVMV